MDGSRWSDYQIYEYATPNIGDIINLTIEGQSVQAQVESIGTAPSKMPGIQSITHVRAAEIQSVIDQRLLRATRVGS
jgi:hypothetical protein